MSVKKSFIDKLFSSDSSDGDEHPKKLSDNEKALIKLNISKSDSERKLVEKQAHKLPPSDIETPDGFMEVNKLKVGDIRHNSVIQYETHKGKFIKPKYFKKYDPLVGAIILGFYTHNKRNYTESISNIKKIYTQVQISGGTDLLKDTIELSKDQWKTLRRDTIVSYEKDSNEYVYKAKFNSFIKGSDGSSKISFTSERGYNYVANPQKIIKIFRHVTGNDKTLTFILEALRKLEGRVRLLENKLSKK
jgi:hypothetical protein